MKKLIKRIAAVNDISTFGKCSLTVAIPALSSMGYEVCPIVTSYLSAHTGFENPVFVDMTEHSQAVISHLKELDVEFDSVYTGYIPTLNQMETVKKFYGKEGEREYIHFCISFKGKMDADTAYFIADNISQLFDGFQVLFAVHLNTQKYSCSFCD